MANIPYDPDCKEAMEQIKGILDKYRLGCSITLISRTHSEFLYHFPDWSIAQFSDDGKQIRIRSKKEDFKTCEQQHRDTEDSVGMLFQIRDIAAQTFGVFSDIVEKLKDKIEIKHTPFSGFSQHFEN